MVKMTFSVDEETAQTLKRTAELLRKPQSMVVRRRSRWRDQPAG
jgi:hypothetical protein